ncbi:MAG: efflux RND transporter permease subunit [Erythrobacter sp.]
MNISVAALRAQPLMLFLVGILMLFGVYSYFTLPAREDPKLIIREAVVTTAYPGLSADQVELLITKPLEERIIALPDIRDIESTSMNGVSIVKPRFDFDTPDLELAFENLAETVAETVPFLPEGAQTPIVNDDFGDIAAMTLALHGPDFSNAELAEYAEHVRDELILVEGTKKVDLLGVRPERIFVEFENAVLSQAGISPNAIAAALDSENTIRPGGTVERADGSITVRPGGDFQNLDDVRSALVRSPSGTLVRLEDIATVSRGYEDPAQRLAYYNNDETVILAVVMEEGLSVLNYSAVAREEVERIAATLPVGLSLDIVTYEATKVEAAVYGVTFNMLQTLAVVLGIIILFLGVRTGLIVGAIIPAVILATFAVMGVFEIALQRMSLATIIISLGLLVDNGIVIAEDFKRRVQELGDRDKALAQTSRELAFPLLVSSLTTIAVFLPLLIANSDSSEYTRSISLVVTISLGVSYVFAMTVTTTLCYLFLKVPEVGSADDEEQEKGRIAKAFDRLTDIYAAILRKVLAFRWLYVAAMVGLFAAAGLLQSAIPKEFFPSNNNPQVLVYIELASGATTSQTDEGVRKIVDLIDDEEKFPEVEDFAAYVGFGGPRFVLSLSPVDPAPNKGFIVINTSDLAGAEAIVPRLRDVFAERVPDINARVTRMFLGPEDPKVIRLQVTGPDADYINARAGDVMDMLAREPGMIDIWSDWRSRTVEVDLEVDQQAARAAGVTSADIALSLQRQLDGQPVSAFREGDESFPIVMRATEDERTSIERLRTSAVYAADGSNVPLGQVAQLKLSGEWGFIQREDMKRTVTVEGRHLSMSPDDLAPQLQPRIDQMNEGLAPGHNIKIAGILEESGKNNAALIATLPIVIGMTFFLLIAQFGDFRRPLVIFLSLPFATFGAFFGLLVMQSPFGFMAILSLFALFGVIINNSIVLVDRIDIERNAIIAEDVERPESAASTSASREREFEAVISACRRRFRPVVMTTLTTIAGLLPLIIAQDVLFYGFASSVAFGLLIGTFVVSLGLTPVLYCLFFGIRKIDPDHEPSAKSQVSWWDWLTAKLPFSRRGAQA